MWLEIPSLLRCWSAAAWSACPAILHALVVFPGRSELLWLPLNPQGLPAEATCIHCMHGLDFGLSNPCIENMQQRPNSHTQDFGLLVIIGGTTAICVASHVGTSNYINATPAIKGHHWLNGLHD